MRAFLFLIAFDSVLSCPPKSFRFFSIQLIKKRCKYILDDRRENHVVGNVKYLRQHLLGT
jgi:hypothetical protein